jgi:hypothetical protein
MENLQAVVGLLARIEHRDFLSLSHPEQLELINQMHQSRVTAIEESQQTKNKGRTKSAKKNSAKRGGAKRSANSAEKKLAKLLEGMSPAQREEFKRIAGMEE